MPINTTKSGEGTLTGRSIQIGRALVGLSQRELAERTKIKPWRLFQIETGKTLVRPDELARILRVLSTEG